MAKSNGWSKRIFSKKGRSLILSLFLFFFLLAYLEGIRCFASLHSATPEVLETTSTYVLPYPSFMPGHRLYRVEQALDTLRCLWAFGNFSRHKYELGMADKKLVEAKNLFEYRQYFLATQALVDSNQHWQKAADYLKKAKNERKDISQKLANFQAAAEKHREILTELLNKLPEEVVWQEEKKEAQKLKIKGLLEESIEKLLITNY